MSKFPNNEWLIVELDHPTPHPVLPRDLQAGDPIRVAATAMDVVFHQSLNGKNKVYSIPASHCHQWIPDKHESVRVQSVDKAYSDKFPTRFSCLDELRPLRQGDLVVVSGHPAPFASVIIDSKTVNLFDRAIRYLDYGGREAFLWLRNIAPMGMEHFLQEFEVGYAKKGVVPSTCSCDLKVLMSCGCSCGAIPRYQEPSL